MNETRGKEGSGGRGATFDEQVLQTEIADPFRVVDRRPAGRRFATGEKKVEGAKA